MVWNAGHGIKIKNKTTLLCKINILLVLKSFPCMLPFLSPFQSWPLSLIGHSYFLSIKTQGKTEPRHVNNTH